VGVIPNTLGSMQLVEPWWTEWMCPVRNWLHAQLDIPPVLQSTVIGSCSMLLLAFQCFSQMFFPHWFPFKTLRFIDDFPMKTSIDSWFFPCFFPHLFPRFSNRSSPGPYLWAREAREAHNQRHLEVRLKLQLWCFRCFRIFDHPKKSFLNHHTGTLW